MAGPFNAIVLAESPLARVRVAGLTACERAVRVARRVGATGVIVVEDDRSMLRAIAPGALLVIRADHLVHTPLVAPLVATPLASDAVAIAVGDDEAYAGALLAGPSAATGVIAALLAGQEDRAIATRATMHVRHGEIACHPIATRDERRAAHRLLYRILIKSQDNAITRYLYRPISSRLTRLLVWTPITPNQVSYLVGALVALGCWLTAHASMSYAIAGTAVILGASYLDCCDGEIARVKLLSSRFGAWIDTVVDELSSVGYMVAIGWHCHLAFGPTYLGDLGFDPWLFGIALGLVTYGWSMYCIYYNIIVGVGSANSQDYAGDFEVIPGEGPNTVRLRPKAVVAIKRDLPRWLELVVMYAPYIVRRDFISWVALFLAIFHLTQVSCVGFLVGGVVTAVIVTLDHVKLRRLRRSIARAGQVLQSPSG